MSRITTLADERRDDLTIGGQQAGVGLGAVVPDGGVKLRQSVIGHHREHVMFDVVVHVPIKEARHRVHHHGPAVQAVVEHVLVEACMLGRAEHELQPRAVEGRQPHQHGGQDAVRDGASHDHQSEHHQEHARGAEHLFVLHRGDEGLFFSRQPAGGVKEEVLESRDAGLDGEEVQHPTEQIRRTVHGDLGVEAYDDRVGMMPRMTPAPNGGFAQHHEGRDIVDGVVHPARLERRAMAAFVPA